MIENLFVYGTLMPRVGHPMGARLSRESRFIGFGSIKGDSQDLVLGAGAAYNVNQMYAMRLEYQKLKLGEASNTGEEDLNVVSLGLVVRF